MKLVESTFPAGKWLCCTMNVCCDEFLVSAPSLVSLCILDRLLLHIPHTVPSFHSIPRCAVLQRTEKIHI